MSAVRTLASTKYTARIMNERQSEPVSTSVPKTSVATTMLAAQSPTIAPTRGHHPAKEPRPSLGRPRDEPG